MYLSENLRSTTWSHALTNEGASIKYVGVNMFFGVFISPRFVNKFTHS